ncbi:hypothetical protein EVAR_54118_1 [Eumeta japonica]|uniref:Uncharacterized protein n=1 Tax=Eumeta variegata TaxID=151549 RepID=A0A4C1YZH9_EUMVA|nr:hypothetical protein EVAR_54118_1 [Eumeta japonica]
MFPLRRIVGRKIIEQWRAPAVSTTSSSMRAFSSEAPTPRPLTVLTEDELAMKETIRKLATEQIGPLVRKMDDEHRIDDSIRQLLFDNGVNTSLEPLVIVLVKYTYSTTHETLPL